MSAAEVTLLRKAANLPLTKRISLGADGSLISDGCACVMSCGTAWRFRFDRFQELAEAIEQFDPDQALALGRLQSDLPAQVAVTTKLKLNGANRPDLIARTRDFFVFRPGEPALALMDVDKKAMPRHVADNIERLGGVLAGADLGATATGEYRPDCAPIHQRRSVSHRYRRKSGGL